MTLRALALDSDTCLRKDFQEKAGLELSSFRSAAQCMKWMQKATPDIALLHFPLPARLADELITKLRRKSVPVILIVKKEYPNDEALHDLLVDFVSSPVNPYELKARARRLQLLKASREVKEQAFQKYPTRAKLLPTNELRNEDSGRLDATRIAGCFGLSINELARTLRRPPTSVHKTPDSERLQESLRPYERVLSAARHIVGDENTSRVFKIWLNSSVKPLGDTPVALIRAGKIGFLADWLEDAVLGLPE
jgi:DNA-binding response OmpR family regulator